MIPVGLAEQNARNTAIKDLVDVLTIAMNDDEKLKIYNKGVEEGKKHTSPSSDTIAMVNNLEKKMTEKIHEVQQVVEKKMDKFETKLDALIATVSCLGDKFVSREDYKSDLSSINRVLEKLKAFRWQLVAGGSVVLYILEKIWK